VDAKTGSVRLTPLIQRVIRSAATLALGVVVGTFASLYHGVLFPWGLVAALGLVTLAVAGVRTLFVERYAIVWTSVGIVGALMLLAGVDGNASVLILADTQGLVLLGGTTLLVVGAIAWPRFPPRTTRYDRAVESAERTHQP
jgi:hypothetical protein